MDTNFSTNRKLIRMFANILRIVVILAMAFPAMGSVYAQDELSPWFTVFPPGAVEGWGWPLGATIHLIIDDLSTDVSPDYDQDETVILAPWGSGQLWVWFEFPGAYNLKPGDIVTLTDGVTPRTHVVQNIAISTVDPDENTVIGIAGVGQNVSLWSWEDPEGRVLEAAADEFGNWGADFDDVGVDLELGHHVRAEVWDDGNDTAVDWYIAPPPNPHFTVFPEWEWFDGLDWPDGAIVSISVEGKSECSLERESWEGFFNGNFPEGCNVEAGDTVTFDDGTTNRWHTVRNLYVTNVDTSENTVTGKADADETVFVWPHDGWFEPLQTIVGGSGDWQVDLDDVGYTIREDSEGRSEIRDEMGNSTASDWHVTHPRFTVFPEWEWFDGNDWPNGVTVNITVAGKPECTTEKESWGYFFNGNFGEGCDLAVGDVVTFTDEETLRTHTVQNLAITKVNQEDDTIKGFASAGAEVYVWPHATGQEQVAIANPKGRWNVNFSGIFDLAPGEAGRSEIRDEMGNATAVDWYVPNPRIVASITEDWFCLQEFTPDKTLSFTVYEAQGEKPIWKGTATTDGSGFAWIDADGRWNLEPGNYLVVKDGSRTKDLVIEGFTFDVFDLTKGLLQGTVPGQEGRHVWAGIGWENNGWSMDVTTDETGAWLADFGQPVPSDFQWVAAQIFDADGDASELRPASQIIFLRPSCGDTYTVQAGSSLEIRYGSWVAIGEELAMQNAEHLTVELVLNGETVVGEKQPVVPRSEIPCGLPLEDAYGVFYVAQVAPLGPGTYAAEVTWSFDEAVTDGYDANGDGEPDWYGPGEVFTHEFTIVVQ
jgi:hypothetical protein